MRGTGRVGVSYGWGASPRRDHRARVREHAVRDVVQLGMSVISAATLWGVQADILQGWVDAARPSEPEQAGSE